MPSLLDPLVRHSAYNSSYQILINDDQTVSWYTSGGSLTTHSVITDALFVATDGTYGCVIYDSTNYYLRCFNFSSPTT